MLPPCCEAIAIQWTCSIFNNRSLNLISANHLGLPGRKHSQTCRESNLTAAARGFFDLVAADLAIERGAFDAQDAGGLALVPTQRVERGQNVAALHFVQRDRHELLSLRRQF